MQIKKGLILVSLSLFLVSTLSAQTFKYIGAAKCKLCHNNEASGEQYNKWLKGPHANALKSLSSEESLAYAKENGISDPAKEAKCLKCHSTYYSVDAERHDGILADEGVSCESCHGPGSSFKTPSIMRNKEQALTKGLILPDNNLCVTCHNKGNPFHREFRYESFAAKISHPNPRK